MRNTIASRLAVAVTAAVTTLGTVGLMPPPAWARTAPDALLNLPADSVVHASQLQSRLDIEVIDPSAYVCSPSSPIRDWLTASKADWTPVDHNLAGLAQQLVLLDTVLFPNDAGTGFGPFTTQVTHTFRDLGKFWDIDPSKIRLLPLRSTMLTDRAKLTRVFTVGWGFPEPVSASLADQMATLMDTDKFQHGRHPGFTFNAFAIGGLEVPGAGTVPPEIVMGDGVLAGMQAVGLGDVAPQAILAHEYGHHVQFQRGLFNSDLTGPEASRRTELMADSFAAYYLTHARGATMQWKRVQQFVEVFAQLGDCSFAGNTHHGTPNQRLHAAEWGYGVANDAQKQGQVLSTLTFASLFEKQLPILVAPDA
ncbi:hypothetical protein ABZX92_24830 [Lentzea sp. NPDC006480]|uniref:hypothetical protein n=1 Tax=Lentzea sp. NPDC006480 TaxID=3157176 RepID=UPI0033A8BC9B